MEKREEDIIHDVLESGGCVTLVEGHDQELIITFMSLTSSFRNIGLFHMYLVVAKM
jgi:hypothetical protein